MLDLIKILISGAVGFAAAMLLEPAKILIKRRKIETALYAEIDFWYDECQRVTDYEDPKEICEERFARLKADVFEHYFNKDRETDFAIHNWQSIRESYDFMLRTQQEFNENVVEVDDAASQIASF